MPKVEVALISGRTSQQGVGLEVGKTSEQYFKSASYIELSTLDTEAMGVQDGQAVRVSTAFGSVVLSAKASKGLEGGMAFLPYGLWANQVFGSETGGTGMPSFKGIRATVEPAGGERVQTLTDLVEELRRAG